MGRLFWILGIAGTAGALASASIAVGPHPSAPPFTQPVLVNGSPTNLDSFDVSWNDNDTERYYLADRTNNAIDLVDASTDTFLGLIGHGRYTGSRRCPNGNADFRHCSGPNGVVTDNHGHVWAGDGEGHLIEADATHPSSSIIRSIATGGHFRVDELAYDPIDQILLASSDGDSPPFVTFVSAVDGSVLSRYVYPMNQDGLEQPVWVRRTGYFYQNVPGDRSRIDVFDPHRLPKPIKSFSVPCRGGLLTLTLSGLAVGPRAGLMTVCGSVGGVLVDAKTGLIGGTVREGADTDEVWYDPGSNRYYFSRPGQGQGVSVVDARSETFIVTIPVASHSVAVNARNTHVFVPASGVGILTVAPLR